MPKIIICFSSMNVSWKILITLYLIDLAAEKAKFKFSCLKKISFELGLIGKLFLKTSSLAKATLKILE